MPVCACLITAVIGTAYALREGLTLSAAGTLLTDAALVLCGTYFYTVAFSPWRGRLGLRHGGEIPHTVSVLFLLSTLLISLSAIELFGFISLGRAAAVLALMLLSYRGGAGVGAVTGVSFGLALDAAAGGTPFFIGVYGICGLFAGLLSRRNRLAFTAVFIAVDAAAAAAAPASRFVPAVLYEVFAASVAFMLLPSRTAARIDAFLPAVSEGCSAARSRDYVRARLEGAAGAFRDLFETVSAAAGSGKNDEDISSVFDAAAEIACRKCENAGKCWHVNYISTVDALNNAVAPMLERGMLMPEDLPGVFSASCLDLDLLVDSINAELRGMLTRRQYRRRLAENRSAAFAQYSDISAILRDFSKELGNGMTAEPVLEERLRKYLLSCDHCADVAVFRLPGGRLRAEISCSGAERLSASRGFLDRVSVVLGTRMCMPASPARGTVVLLEAETLSASVGIACLGRNGRHSGDRGAYFKTDEGLLFIILSDGMGTGEQAAKYSADAVRILESFIRAGIAPQTSVKILSDMMLLKNEDDSGCATVDLICINLFSGAASLYKYGAAPSYFCGGGSEIKRVSATGFAAGLALTSGELPDRFEMELRPGSTAVMVSDGVTNGLDDRWLADLITGRGGESPRELARQIVSRARDKFGSEDDMTAFVIAVEERK